MGECSGASVRIDDHEQAREAGARISSTGELAGLERALFRDISIGIDTCLELSSHAKTEGKRERGKKSNIHETRNEGKEKQIRVIHTHFLSLSRAEPLVNYEHILRSICTLAITLEGRFSRLTPRTRLRGAIMQSDPRTVDSRARESRVKSLCDNAVITIALDSRV